MAKQTLTIFMLLALLAVLGTGCGKKTKAKAFNPPVTVDPRNDDDDNGENHTGGETVEFAFKSTAMLQKYTGRAISLDDIENATINFDFENIEESQAAPKYNGEVRIGYTQAILDPVNGNVTGSSNKLAKFWSSNSTLAENQLFDSQYNVFYAGTTAFKFYVQDSLGALVIVFSEETNDLGSWSGRVFMKNFNYDICGTHYPYICNEQPIRDYRALSSLVPVMDGSKIPCWFLTKGPYACSTILNNANSPTLPPSGYEELGRFDNVDLIKALNIED